MGDQAMGDFTGSDAVKVLTSRIEFLEKRLRDSETKMQRMSWHMVENQLAHDAMDEQVERSVLMTDISGFSRLNGISRERATAALDRLGAFVLGQHGAEYGNDWGDALVGVFDAPDDALNAGLRLVRLMAAEGLLIRVGASFGTLNRVRKYVQNRISFDGFPLIEAARLEPMAMPGEVIASHSLIYSRLVTLDSFEISREQRAWTKAHGEIKVGDETDVFIVRSKMTDHG